MSTSGGYHSTSGGYHSTSGGYHSTSGGYHEYIGECSAHWRDSISTSGEGYHECITGKDIMSTSGDDQYIGGIP